MAFVQGGDNFSATLTPRLVGAVLLSMAVRFSPNHQRLTLGVATD
ncbi:hypothetical protein ACNFD4_13535 [Pseudomonas sp. NY15367]